MLRFVRIASAVLAILFASLSARAEITPEQKQEMEALIREYLLANPEVIEEAIGVLQARREQEAAAAQVKAIEENWETIYNSKHQMVLGNPDGAITLVEFFDYNCGYCRRALSDMMALIETNPDLRVVLKEFPILSNDSVEAARIAVAVKDLAPESYLKFHQELFSRPGAAGANKALEIARDLGLDAEALQAAAASDEVTQNLQEVNALATSLGISGTPSYVIGSELIPGAIGYEGLQEKVTAAREGAAASVR
jgi:protein-disulfide isomerase